jgi:hypothetical protein
MGSGASRSVLRKQALIALNSVLALAQTLFWFESPRAHSRNPGVFSDRVSTWLWVVRVSQMHCDAACASGQRRLTVGSALRSWPGGRAKGRAGRKPPDAVADDRPTEGATATTRQRRPRFAPRSAGRQHRSARARPAPSAIILKGQFAIYTLNFLFRIQMR